VFFADGCPALSHNELVYSELNRLKEENERLRAALREIRDVARVSEGVEFYAMLAEKGLGNG
jgi:hypothetical protein